MEMIENQRELSFVEVNVFKEIAANMRHLILEENQGA
jgi:hypothetical protein